ncbi:GUN4 domain-containing protein [Scytonema hofmannii FACHB-248]|uniref:GUN4 domain-containing protein n=1 Tax=Scytonema hofmannii FACHB-248 TaxID=1842502 RepID=A0ABR8GP93_9CYAN|nr:MULTISPECIES: GUN4 domain-containing protein [Nostocales]MBD2604869.1 GUN4 domain-containing protein [Scytonema hofmannii FACHB-248]
MISGIIVKKILILSANPKGTKPLRLGEEIREIKDGLRRARERERFIIESAEGVRYRDIRRAILDYEPHIIHFSGHGLEEGLIFEDDTGREKLVDPQALAGLFELFADRVECVLLNACYSEHQAKAIAQHIDYVVGMSQAIDDKAAIEFAIGFYDALLAGKSVEIAYKFGRNAIQMASISEHLTPQLLRKNQLSLQVSPLPQTEEEEKLPQQQESTCTTSTTSKQETEELPSEKNVDYTHLRDLLKAENWKKADEETHLVMLKASGREQEGWLNVKAMNNFPCTDLQTIDKLWVKYTTGRLHYRKAWRSHLLDCRLQECDRLS